MIWIRTQDRKKLIECRAIEIETNTDYTNIFGDDTWLGTYPTEKRALEVLDEIQQHILGKVFIPNEFTRTRGEIYKEHDWELPLVADEPKNEKIKLLPIIYQMPKE
jgi:hypothetical protein